MSQFTGAEWIDSLVQDWSNSIANALELLQYCTKPPKLIYYGHVCETTIFLHMIKQTNMSPLTTSQVL